MTNKYSKVPLFLCYVRGRSPESRWVKQRCGGTRIPIWPSFHNITFLRKTQDSWSNMKCVPMGRAITAQKLKKFQPSQWVISLAMTLLLHRILSLSHNSYCGTVSVFHSAIRCQCNDIVNSASLSWRWSLMWWAKEAKLLTSVEKIRRPNGLELSWRK